MGKEYSLREHILHLFEKGFVRFLRFGIEFFIGLHLLEEFPLLPGEFFRGPHIYMNQQVSRTIAIQALDSLVSQSQDLAGLNARLQLDTHLTRNRIDLLGSPQDGIGNADI